MTMKRLIFLIALAGSIALAFWWTAGVYIALALVFAAVFSWAENLFSREVPKVSISSPVIEEGGTPVLRVETEKMCRGTILAENSFTHEKTELSFCAEQSGEVPLTGFENCGEIRFSFKKLRRFDICSLTSKRVGCGIEGSCTVMPKAKYGSDIAEDNIASAERELSGAREYIQGDELRRINFKLTHRFSKIYINTFAPEENGLLCLFFDMTCPDDTTVFAEQLRVFAGASRYLSAQGTDHCAAFMSSEGFRLMRGARSGLDDILAAILRSPTSRGGSTLPAFLNDVHSAELERIVCFSAHDIPMSERVLPINMISGK